VPEGIVDPRHFFIVIAPHGVLFVGNISPKSFMGRFLDFILAQQNNGESKTDNSAQQRTILQSVCIGLINALSGCVGPDMPEAQFH
jgi:hypothetical protein